ncbi:hypothetical protein J6590_070405 [Homalodisca vitripennis]|nr:hypothetical protein J6590_070405 [Homalodisca vitripennis]
MGARVEGRLLITTFSIFSLASENVWKRVPSPERKWATDVVFRRNVLAVHTASRSPPRSCRKVTAWLAHPLGMSRMTGGMRGSLSTSNSAPAVLRHLGARAESDVVCLFRIEFTEQASGRLTAAFDRTMSGLRGIPDYTWALISCPRWVVALRKAIWEAEVTLAPPDRTMASLRGSLLSQVGGLKKGCLRRQLRSVAGRTAAVCGVWTVSSCPGKAPEAARTVGRVAEPYFADRMKWSLRRPFWAMLVETTSGCAVDS